MCMRQCFDREIFLFFLRRKLSVRIQELEDLLEQTRLRCSNLERTKSKLTAELKEVTIELENVSKQKIFSRQLYTCTLGNVNC